MTLRLRFVMVTPMVVTMGDKSPKSKQRDQKQKDAARAEDAAHAKSKQASFNQAPPVPGKGRK